MRLSINELSSNMVVHCLFCARNDEKKLFNELHWTVCDIFVRVEFCEILNVPSALETLNVLFLFNLIFYSV